jgi:TnpA family transposase
MADKNSLSNRKRHQSAFLPQDFSDEEMVRDWTLSDADLQEIGKYRKSFRLYFSMQLCAVRLYGRFLLEVKNLSPRIISYLNTQLELPPSLTIDVPDREATVSEQRKNILKYLSFSRFDKEAQSKLQDWLEKQANQGLLPDDLYFRAERFLLSERIILPGASVLERFIVSACADVHERLFERLYKQLSPALKTSIDELLTAQSGDQRSLFYLLKEYPPSATISSIRRYLGRYQALNDTGIDAFEVQAVDSAFLDYIYRLAKQYNAKDIKRFNKPKRYSMMLCFLLETRKVLLDHLVKMHDQYIMELLRQSKRTHEKKHRELRKRQKRAIDTILDTTSLILDWPDNKALNKSDLWHRVDESKLLASIEDLQSFKRLEERGYGEILLSRYPSLRKYFADLIQLPFEATPGTEPLLNAIEQVRQLDAGTLKKLPDELPTAFIPRELRRSLKGTDGKVQRNAWEMGVAIAVKEALRSGDLYLPKSKQHVSFWDLLLDENRWQETREASYEEIQQPFQTAAKSRLVSQFHKAVEEAEKRFALDSFAEIKDGNLKLKKYDRAEIPEAVTRLQKVIDASMPSIRIEQLLMDVDRQTSFTRHFLPVQKHQSRPKNFYKTLISALISQATNLGVVSMSASVKDVSVDMLRHVLQFYVREETIKVASAEIVNQHHQLPFSEIHGTGSLSSSDAQRFKIRADSLLAAYYPRYYGYYEKAIGIYTHVSDQYSVYSTKVISCNPREALYVLDGLLENNTILKIRQHTTDTHGYTEIVFALCYLLGYYFMPRIRDLKDQQLYRVDRNANYGVFTPLLNKTADLDIIEEQWESMIWVAQSLKERTAPAHIIVERLTNSYPSDRLSKAFANLGRIIKTEYILRYLTDQDLRRTVQLQLNKGEYRHKLPRWIFFANQGEFTTGDYEEIMNKASALSLVSNAILYWNTSRISQIVDGLREQGEVVDNETLAHISLLPYKHVLPNGTYFIEDEEGE